MLSLPVHQYLSDEDLARIIRAVRRGSGVNHLRVALVGAGSMAANHAHVIMASGCAVASRSSSMDTSTGPNRSLMPSAQPQQPTWRGPLSVMLRSYATATSAHAESSFELVDAGLPVLVEKPLTEKLVETHELVDRASAHDVVLMCGFVERFNPALRVSRRVRLERSVIDSDGAHWPRTRAGPFERGRRCPPSRSRPRAQAGGRQPCRRPVGRGARLVPTQRLGGSGHLPVGVRREWNDGNAPCQSRRRGQGPGVRDLRQVAMNVGSTSWGPAGIH